MNFGLLIIPETKGQRKKRCRVVHTMVKLHAFVRKVDNWYLWDVPDLLSTIVLIVKLTVSAGAHSSQVHVFATLRQ